MAIEITGLDVKSGLELCGGDEGIYTNALRLYVTNVPPALDKMRNVSENTLQSYAVSVHGIKSTSEYIGAEEARSTAKQLEAMAKSGDLAGVQAKSDAFIQHVEQLIGRIRSWLEKNSASS